MDAVRGRLLLALLALTPSLGEDSRCRNLDGSIGDGWCISGPQAAALDAALLLPNASEIIRPAAGAPLLAQAEVAFTEERFQNAAGLFREARRQRLPRDSTGQQLLAWRWGQAHLHVRCGAAWRRARQFAEARIELDRALQLFPRHTAALRQRALLLLDTRSPRRAQTLLEDLLRHDRTVPGLLPLLARATASTNRQSSGGAAVSSSSERGPASREALHEAPSMDRQGAAMRDRLAALHNVSYWRALAPELHVADAEFQRRHLAAGSGSGGSQLLNLTDDLIQRLRQRFIRDGYVHLDERLPWATAVRDLAHAVEALRDAGWPAAFLQLYDEAWLVAEQLRELLRLTTGGNLFLGDFAIFYVDPAEPGAAGWGPHRDRGGDAAGQAFRDDGTALYHTAWVALTDAAPANSCLMLVPPAHDPGYKAGDHGRDPLLAVSPQKIRAVPTVAGGVVAFTHRLLHWGSATDTPEPGGPPLAPRVALSFAVADEEFEPPYFSRSQLPFPPLALRLALAAGNLIIYSGNEEVNPSLTSLLWAVFEHATSSDSSDQHSDSSIDDEDEAAEDASAAQVALDPSYVKQVTVAHQQLRARREAEGWGDGRDHYSVLDLCVDHSNNELEQAFASRRELADPKHHAGVGSIAALRRVNAAYATLQNSTLRQAYDYGAEEEKMARRWFPERFSHELFGVSRADGGGGTAGTSEKRKKKAKKNKKKKKEKKKSRRSSE